MKKLLYPLALLLSCFSLTFGQTDGVSINTSGQLPDSSAILDVSSVDRGVLIPRMTTTQRNAISNPATGLLIYNTDTDCVNMWTGAFWAELCGQCAIPNPNPSNNGPVCEGDTLFLSAQTIPGASYSWSGPNGFSSNQQNPFVANATSAASGTYTLTVTAGGCSGQSFTTQATVSAIPSAPSIGSNSPVIVGGTINLTAPTIAGASYNWTGPNGFSSTQQNPSISNATNADSGTYSCFVVVNSCTSNVASIVVSVNTISFLTYTSSGTFTVPGGVTSVRVLCVGGGGGGGSGHQGGGGSGYVATGTYSVTPGQNIAITVGQGGTGAQQVVSTNTLIGLTPGGSSSFGGLLTANGGLVVTGVNQTGNNGGCGGGGSCNSGSPGGNGGTNGGNGGSCSYTGGSGQGGSFSSGFGTFTANTISAGSGGAGGTGSHAGGGGGGGVLINGAGPTAAGGPQSFSADGGVGYGAGGGAGTYDSSSNIRWEGGDGNDGVVYIEW
jgi:hypothetical protein